MFMQIDPLWREAFALAWEAFCRGNVPVGCLIVNGAGQVVARGQNAIFDDHTVTPLAGTDLAHAEMVALSRLRIAEHNTTDYTLYTTLEPCPMCFGAIAMTGLKQVRYAARDGVAGSAVLSRATPYLVGKRITLLWEESPLEVFQIALSTTFELERQHPKQQRTLGAWRAHCPAGVQVGGDLFAQGYFSTAVRDRWPVEQVYAEVMANLTAKSGAEAAAGLGEVD